LIPLTQVDIDLPSEFFQHLRYRNNRPLPSLKALHIPVEVAIGLLLLKMSPEDLVTEMKPQFWRGMKEGGESVERLYTNWSSSKYACEAQKFVHGWWETKHVPLVLYVSIFVE
jgi:hypothetical protein